MAYPKGILEVADLLISQGPLGFEVPFGYIAKAWQNGVT